jgi:hypothetical protein
MVMNVLVRLITDRGSKNLLHIIQEFKWNTVNGNSDCFENYLWDGKINPLIGCF